MTFDGHRKRWTDAESNIDPEAEERSDDDTGYDGYRRYERSVFDLLRQIYGNFGQIESLDIPREAAHEQRHRNLFCINVNTM